MPALAPHDSQNATECSRNGSSEQERDRPRARARARSTRAGRRTTSPTRRSPAPRRAAPTARSASSSRTAARSRARRPCAARAARRRSNGPKSASVNATFSPDTASRCDSPESRYAATTSSGTARVSPSRKPASSARGVGGSGAVPRSTTSRSPLATPQRAARGREREHLDAVEAADRVPPPGATVEAGRRAAGRAGRSSTTRSPASSTRNRSASSPVATANSVRCAPADRHAHERVGVEPAALRIVDEHAGERRGRAARDRGRAARSAPDRSSARSVCARAEQRERDDRDRDAAPARRRTTRTERDDADDEQRRSPAPARRARPPTIPSTRPPSAEQHAALVHVRPSRGRGAARAGRRRCRERG